MTSAIGMAKGMNDVERFEVDIVGDVCGPRFEMKPHPAGDWVEYETYHCLQQQLAAAREALQAAEVERDAWHHSSDKDLMRWRDAEEKLRRLQSQEGLMALANTLRQARHYVKHAVAHAPFAGNDPEVPMCVLNNVDAAISWLDYSEIPAATLQRDRQP